MPDKQTLFPIRKRLALGLLAALALILCALAVIVATRPGPLQAATAKPTNPAPLEASPALGPASAPVTIIEYADFGCSTCWYWYQQGVLDQLRSKYGDKIRFVWRDFPVITLLSPKAAEAGQCANQQGKFWEFHDAVYENKGLIEAANLLTYAAAAGVDMPKFNECVTSRRYQERVNAEQTEGFDHGFTGTPAFLVNNQRLIGPMSLSVFSEIIDALLASKK